MTERWHRRIQEWAGKRSKRYDVPLTYSEHQMLKRIRQLINEGREEIVILCYTDPIQVSGVLKPEITGSGTHWI